MGTRVLSIFLYPDLWSGALGLADGDAWVLMMVLAGVGMMAWPVVAAIVLRSLGAPSTNA